MNNQKRSFILSSFRRLGIPFSVSVYNFADYVCNSGWMPPLGSLEEVDREILIEYNKYIQFD